MTFTAKVVTAVVSSLGVGGTGVTSYIYLSPLIDNLGVASAGGRSSSHASDIEFSFQLSSSSEPKQTLGCKGSSEGDKKYPNLKLLKKDDSTAEISCVLGNQPQQEASLRMVYVKTNGDSQEAKEEEVSQEDNSEVAKLKCSSFESAPNIKNFNCDKLDNLTLSKETNPEKLTFKINRPS
ncbi:hypothetical protein MHLP_00900 [Candidatus Mycoplasma haematolamae str. Purdue]|uniref:Uncharacterized protein n=1 Tax=Mycoplasma haematolamae (strain Purdue) TaxID=1212765 RepID=I7B922_MYCHA|nr:hypothetical protein [Candidatus Mycoplasma haematolamae]AFO51760.1 hypothetical protein MHLP_00900 [Candidatus Mycoplasma haematolamae str. Purdue]